MQTILCSLRDRIVNKGRIVFDGAAFLSLYRNYNKTCFCKREDCSFCERILLRMIYFFYIMAKDYTAGVAAAGEV